MKENREKCASKRQKPKSVTSMDLEERHVIKFLHLKGLKLEAIAAELADAYGQDAYTKPSIKYWVHQIKLGRTDLTTQHIGERPTLDVIDAEIVSALRKLAFSSTRTISDSLGIPASTVYSHLVERIGFKNYLLRWIPHMLTADVRQKRVELSKQLFPVLESQQRVGFHDIVTSDESWFLQHYDHRQIWCVSADEVPTRVNHTIATPKTMLTVFLSVRGVVFTNWLPLAGKFKSSYFCTEVLEPLAQILHDGRIIHSARPIVHFDNATPHRAAAPKVASSAPIFAMLPSHPTALISVHATFFSSAI
jgi:hypothetical protein